MTQAQSIYEDDRPATAWPSNGVPFNRWYTGLHRFLVVLQHFRWIKQSEFKYVNIRIDTRNGNFIILSDKDANGERRRVDPDEIAKHVDMTAVNEVLSKINFDLR